ncbi:hypothetical protein K9M47_03275 [Candidatus Gracilibacteria bacterium]|nr:hypothetical protein [Candidatus Gracilibacteria bacterium]
MKIFKSRTFWTIFVMFIASGMQALEPFLAPDAFIALQAILSVFASYFKANPSQTYGK